jgi:hypothetical protein
MIEKYQEADDVWFAKLQEKLDARHRMVIVEWPFNKPGEIEHIINMATEAHFTPIVHMMYFVDLEELVERDIARRVTTAEEAQEAIKEKQGGSKSEVAQWVNQSFRLQQACPGVFDKCKDLLDKRKDLGGSVNLYSTYRRKLGTFTVETSQYPRRGRRLIVCSKAGHDLIPDPFEQEAWRKYVSFRRTAFLNPDVDFECTVSDDPKKYLTVTLGRNVYLPDVPSREDIIRDHVPDRFQHQAKAQNQATHHVEPSQGVLRHIKRHTGEDGHKK